MQTAAHGLNPIALQALRQKIMAQPMLPTPTEARVDIGWSHLCGGRVRLVDAIDHEGRSVLVLAPRRDNVEPYALTAVEERIARRAGLAQSNKEIGAALRLSESTVENHLSRALRKLGVRDRVALARLYTQLEALGCV